MRTRRRSRTAGTAAPERGWVGRTVSWAARVHVRRAATTARSAAAVAWTRRRRRRRMRMAAARGRKGRRRRGRAKGPTRNAHRATARGALRRLFCGDDAGDVAAAAVDAADVDSGGAEGEGPDPVACADGFPAALATADQLMAGAAGLGADIGRTTKAAGGDGRRRGRGGGEDGGAVEHCRTPLPSSQPRCECEGSGEGSRTVLSERKQGRRRARRRRCGGDTGRSVCQRRERRRMAMRQCTAETTRG